MLMRAWYCTRKDQVLNDMLEVCPGWDSYTVDIGNLANQGFSQLRLQSPEGCQLNTR